MINVKQQLHVGACRFPHDLEALAGGRGNSRVINEHIEGLYGENDVVFLQDRRTGSEPVHNTIALFFAGGGTCLADLGYEGG